MNVNTAILEYGLLGLSLIAATVLAVTRVMPITDAVPIITAILSYGIGAAKGASLSNAMQDVTTPAQPVQPVQPPVQPPAQNG